MANLISELLDKKLSERLAKITPETMAELTSGYRSSVHVLPVPDQELQSHDRLTERDHLPNNGVDAIVIRVERGSLDYGPHVGRDPQPESIHPRVTIVMSAP